MADRHPFGIFLSFYLAYLLIGKRGIRLRARARAASAGYLNWVARFSTSPTATTKPIVSHRIAAKYLLLLICVLCGCVSQLTSSTENLQFTRRAYIIDFQSYFET